MSAVIMSDWWAGAIQWTIWAIIMTLVMAWLARSRLKRRPPADSRRLHHPASTLIVGAVTFVFFAGIAVISNVYANRTTTWWTTVIFVGFAVMSVPIMLDYFLARHDVSDEGLSYGRMLGGRGYIKWSELHRVHYAPVLKWFRLETREGKVARISAMLVGLPEFAQVLLRRAPPGAIDDETAQVLRATAAGDLPPLP
jgi:heme/copper-type cytochrome/quinol oxidase subunit 4